MSWKVRYLVSAASATLGSAAETLPHTGTTAPRSRIEVVRRVMASPCWNAGSNREAVSRPAPSSDTPVGPFRVQGILGSWHPGFIDFRSVTSRPIGDSSIVHDPKRLAAAMLRNWSDV